LFLAVISPLAVLGRAWRPDSAYRIWRLAALAVLAITSLAWILFPHGAGYIGGSAWLILLFLPAVGIRRVAELSARQNYTAARKLATVIARLHPSDDLRQQIQLLRTLESRQAAGLISTPRCRQSGRTAGIGNSRKRRPSSRSFWSMSVRSSLKFPIVIGPNRPCSIGWARLNRTACREPRVLASFHRAILACGPIHLLFNLFALYVLGPPLERAIGSVRFCACYLISGLGSSAGWSLSGWLG